MVSRQGLLFRISVAIGIVVLGWAQRSLDSYWRHVYGESTPSVLAGDMRMIFGITGFLLCVLTAASFILQGLRVSECCRCWSTAGCLLTVAALSARVL